MTRSGKKHSALLKVEKHSDPADSPIEVAADATANNLPANAVQENSLITPPVERPLQPFPGRDGAPPQTGRPPNPSKPAWADRMRGARAVGSVATALGDLRDHNNAEIATLRQQLTEGQTIIELDPDKIDSSFIADRMNGADEATDELAELIAAQGQLVPILVRPSPHHPDRYQVAYGHRRLKAVAQLGKKVRAVVRTLSDEDLIIAQGQENNARLDLTYVEKARFAAALVKMNFKRKVVEQALGVNHSQVVWFLQIADAIPDSILTAIGPAPAIGRPRWRHLADLIAAPGNTERAATIVQTPEFQNRSSDERFGYLVAALTAPAAEPQERLAWSDPLGLTRATFTASQAKSIIQIDRRNDPDFAQFLFTRLDDLYRDYRARKGKKKS